MHILLVCPRFPDSLWNFEGIHALAGVASAQSPIGLATIAALTPPEIAISLVDENLDPVDYDVECDVVAISCFNVQYARAVEIAAEFRRRGRRVAIGGPYPTLCPERFTGVADVVFVGEAEYTWPQFCRDLLAGRTPAPVYEQERGKVRLTDSPVPRYDLLPAGKYLYYYVQTTRGCPFQCEFCDIIVTDGRLPRTKTVAQVMSEIETLHRLGARYISFSDANLIANPKYAQRLLTALRDFGVRHGFPIRFAAELTLNVVEFPQLLELLRDSNFESVFIGVESPRTASLLETKKRQNVHGSLLENIRAVQSHNLMVIAGMIVGFDNDDVGIFQDTFDFLQEAGIPFTTAGVLFAIEKTPLHARLEREGRLLEYDPTTVRVHGNADLNFRPQQMSVEELRAGYNWMIRALYRYDYYARRLVQSMRQFTPSPAAARRTPTRLTFQQVAMIGRILVYFLCTRDRARRRFFLSSVWQSMRERPSMQKLIVTVSFLTLHKHFHEYVHATHGDPETAGAVSPFAGRVDRGPASAQVPAHAERPVALPAGAGVVRSEWRAPAVLAGGRD
jgi:radical SAM superfamily enzyme YgiQ (UPF0313 family)